MENCDFKIFNYLESYYYYFENLRSCLSIKNMDFFLKFMLHFKNLDITIDFKIAKRFNFKI